MIEERSVAGDAVVITGASSGIGEATANAFAAGGADVVLAARSEDELGVLADDIEADHGVQALPVPTDVTDREQVDALIDATVEELGGLDVLVNNAGVGLGDDVETLSDEQYHTMTDVNVDGVFFATRAALPHLRESAGALVFLGSFAGRYPRPANPAYAATKWWVRGFARSLDADVGGAGVGVTVINPAEVRTEFGGEEGASMSERFEPGTAIEPATVAEAIVFAASHDIASEIDLSRKDKLADSIQ